MAKHDGKELSEFRGVWSELHMLQSVRIKDIDKYLKALDLLTY